MVGVYVGVDEEYGTDPGGAVSVVVGRVDYSPVWGTSRVTQGVEPWLLNG